MHNQITPSVGADQESHLSPTNTYVPENWVDMSSFQNQATMPDYGVGYGFMPPPITHGLPSESLGRMPPPPPVQALPQQPPTAHTQLPMLMMPHAPWPSMLTNPNSYGPPHSAPPVPIPSIAAPLKTSKLPAIQTTSQPRKTLTDEDRRAMCQYAEDHPTAKQTDIGARFGVERSTVSKVLRNKEKYLNLEERSSSPVKRSSKGKGANVEKALINYVQKAKKNGIAVTRETLKEKALAFTSLASGDSLIEFTSSAWLEKFMSKHGIGSARLTRRASETNIPDSARASGSPALAPSQPQSAISPTSPAGHLSPSPLSASKSDEEKERNLMGFAADSTYQQSNSQGTASLSDNFTDAAAPAFSGSAISPTASFSFSPDPNVGAFLPADQGRQVPPHGAGFQRPRSQTFPTLDLEYLNQAQPTEPETPKYHVPSTAPSSALESSSSGPIFGFEQALSPQLRHSSSSSSIAGRSSATPITASAIGSSPGSPTQEDARRAADTLLSFITNASGLVDQNEYMTVVRLTEKLRLQSQAPKTAAHGMGGLSRIPEGDSEMPNAPPVMMKMESTMSA
ncbi:hypothetical protein VTH06DRAFT_3712 [Thermothelomyces fergusii]